MILSLTVFVAACSPETTTRSQPVKTGSPEDLAMKSAKACALDAAGPLACLSATFKTDACKDAEVLAATIAEDTPDAKLRITTSYWADGDCHTALRKAARQRGFDGDPFMAFAPFGQNGYRETLDFTTGADWHGQAGEKSGIV